MSRYSLLSNRLQRIEARMSEEAPNNIEFLDNYSFIVNKDERRAYRPYPTLLKLHQAGSVEDLNVVCIMGAYGSGKSVGCMSDVILRASNMPAWNNGVRSSKWLFVRNTAGQLQTTTLQTWLEWFGDLDAALIPGRKGDPVLIYKHRWKDFRGWVELEIIFLGLDALKDKGKIKSLNLTGAYLNEASELNQEVFQNIVGRCGRYPDENFCKEPYWKGVIADTNPPDEGHWLEKDFDSLKVNGYILLKQPPALIKNANNEWENNPIRENAKPMGNYWLNMAKISTEEFIKVHCLGLYGTIKQGEIVYTEYNDDIHSVSKIDAIKGLPLYLFFDFGLTPTCLLLQQSLTGQIRAIRLFEIREAGQQRMGLRQFIEFIVLPKLSIEFPGFEVYHVGGDMAGNKGVDTDENTCFNILNGYWPNRCEPDRTNKINPRLESVRYLFSQMIGGQPLFILCRTGCSTLRKGLLGKYVFKKLRITGIEGYKDEPEKDEWSHSQDCLQSAGLYFTNLIERPSPMIDKERFMNTGTIF